jgi:MFS family permease
VTGSPKSPAVLGFRDLTRAGQLLVVNQLGINLGFYMVLPFLAAYLRHDLGFATALVGLILGLRTLSQQGLYLVGGTASDRLGPQPMIVLGCGLRVAGFGLFALTTSVAGIVAATLFTGIAGAFFNPAVRAYLTHEHPDRRAEAFAVFNVVGNAGAVLGPLVGVALLGVSFQVVSLGACLVFAALTIAQVLALPRRATAPLGQTVLASWGEVLANGRFLAFTLAGSAYFTLVNQLYLALPLEAQRVTGRAGAVMVLFVVSTVIGIACQMPVTRWCRAQWSAGRATAVGLALMGASYLPLAIAAPLIPDAEGPLALERALLTGGPVLLGTVVFTVAVAIASPFVMELLPIVGSERLVGTYYGYFSLVSALIATGIGALVGALLDLTAPITRCLPFATLALTGVVGGVAIAAMDRRRLLDRREARG